MQTKLSFREIETLDAIAKEDYLAKIPRIHLERFSRLDLIEPSGAKFKLSLKGENCLFSSKEKQEF